MAFLTHPIRAQLVHGITHQIVERCTLDAGTHYQIERPVDGARALPSPIVAILVDGYRYLVRASALGALPAEEVR